jgi:hypothetical protein
MAGYYPIWEGACHACQNESEVSYMSLRSLSLLCRGCWDIEAAAMENAKNAEGRTGQRPVKQLSPGMEWEIPKKAPHE